MAWFRAHYPVGYALVIALGVVVGDEVVNGCPQGPLSKQDHPLQTAFLYGPQKSFG